MSEKEKDKGKDDVYFVGFNDGAQVRQALLETAKVVIYAARSHGKIAEIQDKKLKIRTELSAAVRQAHDDLKRIKELLPYKEEPVAKPRATAHRGHQDHKLDKIEAALHEIEMRMRTL